MAAAPYWALCRGQADGRLHARSREQAQSPPPPPPTTHHHPPPTPNRPLLYNRWLLAALTGPWPKCCIVHRYCCHLYRKQGARCVASYHMARDRGKVLLSAPKLPQFKGAAAKTGVPPEGNILLYFRRGRYLLLARGHTYRIFVCSYLCAGVVC